MFTPIAGRRGRGPRLSMFLLLGLSLIPAAFAARDARASVAVSASGSSGSVGVSFFYSDLQPYGQWIDDPTYGYCWVPGSVVADWRPYWYGHWAYTDFGWTWVSDEPWGWAVYHYGRWFYDPVYGWVWMPGTVWGPAWVDWRWSDDCVGWAPLPPAASWGVWGGLSFHDASAIPARGWSFVEPRSFVAVDLHNRVLPVGQNQTLFHRTRDVTWIGVHNGRPMNAGVAVSSIEQRTGRRVDRLTVVDAPSAARNRGPSVNREQIGFYRPQVRRSTGFVPHGRNSFAGRDGATVMHAPGSQSPRASGWQHAQPESHDRSPSPATQRQPEPSRSPAAQPPHGRPGHEVQHDPMSWQRAQAPPRSSEQNHGPRAQYPSQSRGQDHGARPAPQPTPDQRVAQGHGSPDHGERAPDPGRQGGHEQHGHGKDKGKGESG